MREKNKWPYIGKIFLVQNYGHWYHDDAIVVSKAVCSVQTLLTCCVKCYPQRWTYNCPFNWISFIRKWEIPIWAWQPAAARQAPWLGFQWHPSLWTIAVKCKWVKETVKFDFLPLCGFEFGGPWHQPSGSSKYGSSHCKYHDVDVDGILITGGQRSSETEQVKDWSTGYAIFSWQPMVAVAAATTQWQFQVWLHIENTMLVWVAPLSLDDAVKWKWASGQVTFKHLPTDSGIC